MSVIRYNHFLGGIGINIQDVAKEAGVSVATVSRALNDKDNVTSETKKLVMDTIERLGYHPNLLGRNLRKKETKMVLVLLNSIVNTFFAKIVQGIENVAQKSGYNIMICTTYDDPVKTNKYCALLKNHLADGAIILGGSVNSMDKSQLYELSKNFHIVHGTEYMENMHGPCVTIDNFKAAYDVTNYLISHGKRDILHVSVNNISISTLQRFSGYKIALENAGIPFREDWVVYGSYGYKSSVAAVTEALKSGKRPDAVFAISDRMAAGAMKALKNFGLKIPGDVSVFGFDNTDLAKIHEPGISSVSQSQYDLGCRTMQILIDKIAGNPVPEKVILNYDLIIRESTN